MLRGDAEANPGPDERGDARGAVRGRHHPPLARGAIDDRCQPPPARAAPSGSGRQDRQTADARTGGIRSVSLDLLYDSPDASLTDWIEALEERSPLAPDHLSLYALPLPRRSRRGRVDGPGRRSPPDATAGARRWRAAARPAQDEDRAAAQYHPAVHRLAADGWRELRDQQLGPTRPRAGTTSSLLGAPSVRAVGPTPHAFDGSTRRWNAARLEGYLAALTPAVDKYPAFRQVARGSSTRRPRPVEAVILRVSARIAACRSRAPTGHQPSRCCCLRLGPRRPGCSR